MKCVGLIRHGERAANAGEASLDHASIPLKPKGFKQARLVRRVIRLSPRSDRCLPALLSPSKCDGDCECFSSVAFKTWPIQEFTHLVTDRCADTTAGERG
ncbi:histidine phosphatase family protein [Pseudomonas fragi]|uniref:histidine phosphatase family protein n=1 Tax=Pseudomonas fragi TaxID=296 RepID=UPI003C6E0056